MEDRETYNLEYKEKITDTFLKTVSAFANYFSGKIIFGINDNGQIVGMSDLRKKSLNIENKINDNISPRPKYKIEIDEKKSLIIIEVFEGKEKPYEYKNKAYMRQDSSSLPVDREEYHRLILEGKNLNYEDLQSKEKKLSFDELAGALKEKKGINKLSIDILKTLGLYEDDDGYNIAAEIISDKNSFKGIDIVKFGNNINEFRERMTLENISILEMYSKAVEMYKRYYKYEIIDGIVRKEKETIPAEAFREALANALVHRKWDINAYIKISMKEDSIEINSPGGLPKGISREEYLEGQVSILRNEKIASLFNRIGLIEKFGTGIERIKYLYLESYSKPEFKIFDNSISVILPIMKYELEDLSENASKILNIMTKNKEMSRIEIENLLKFEKWSTLRALDELMENNLVIKVGVGRGTKYKKM